MNDTVISASSILLSKKIPFCVYRFPKEQGFRLAISAEYLANVAEQSFWMAPFTRASAAEDIKLSVVPNNLLDETFLERIAQAPEQPEGNVVPPAETSQKDYFGRLDKMMTDIRAGKVDKVVMSRVIHTAKPDKFDAVDHFLTLTRDYPNTFVYLLNHPLSGMWMGATPELLLKKRGAEITAMALAGTRDRNEERRYDWRPKEMEEHQMVWEHIETAFQNNGCEWVERDGPKTIESGRVAHLKTDYKFRESGKMNLEKLLDELHPTPAIGGLPAKEGVQCILEHEGYDRKYYCGFIGQTDFTDSADLFINLRCMQIFNEGIAVYVGGGITAASDPKEEWHETVMKSRTMIEKLYSGKPVMK